MTKQAPSKTVTVHVPMKFSARGGRKVIITEAIPASPPPSRTEEALLKALAKAFRWRKQIEEGEFSSITELAKANGVNDSYACRLLRLTLLSPRLVTSILDLQRSELSLKLLCRPLPVEWSTQEALLRFPTEAPHC
ncbi:MAG: hypothetical protein JSR61_13125 [Proteobacteria bacterium]|nr:hypothetical protein [Pseudomonadota bacterium]